MKIVTWNSHFGFTQKKAAAVCTFPADIYVIQEVTEDDNKNIQIWENSIWYGDSIDSKYGIGLFSDKYRFRIAGNFDKSYRYIVPVIAASDTESHTLFVVWTKDKDKDGKEVEYTEQLLQAFSCEDYADTLKSKVIILGDFNSNVCWDDEYVKSGKPTHSDIVNKLGEYNITSAYHSFYGLEQGCELHKTLYWSGKADKGKLRPFHIDYCFVSEHYRVKNLKVGSYDDFVMPKKLSDHAPLFVEVEEVK